MNTLVTHKVLGLNHLLAEPIPSEERIHLALCSPPRFYRHSWGDRMRNKLKSMTNSQKDSHLLAGENKTLLLGRNAFLFLHALFDAIYLVRGLNVDLDFLAGQGLMER